MRARGRAAAAAASAEGPTAKRARNSSSRPARTDVSRVLRGSGQGKRLERTCAEPGIFVAFFPPFLGIRKGKRREEKKDWRLPTGASPR